MLKELETPQENLNFIIRVLSADITKIPVENSHEKNIVLNTLGHYQIKGWTEKNLLDDSEVIVVDNRSKYNRYLLALSKCNNYEEALDYLDHHLKDEYIIERAAKVLGIF